jgi:DNA-directed RNA polymerase subunit RPC12/RpoP
MNKLPVYEMLIDESDDSDLQVDFISLVDKPATLKLFNKFSKDMPEETITCKECGHSWASVEGGNDPYKCHKCSYDNAPKQAAFAIQSEEQRIISGPLMVANQRIKRYDEERGEYEVFFSPATIKKIAIKLAKKGFQNNVNLMHAADMKLEGVTLFEIFQSDKERGIMPMKGFEDLADGSLFGSMYVDNDQAWELIKEGKVKGFSVEGNFGMKGKDKYDLQMEEIISILSETNE